MKYIQFIKDYLAYKQGSFMRCSERLESRMIKLGVARVVSKKEYSDGLKELREAQTEEEKKDCEDCKDSKDPKCSDCGDNQKGIKNK